jgi:hypothetical protein
MSLKNAQCNNEDWYGVICIFVGDINIPYKHCCAALSILIHLTVTCDSTTHQACIVIFTAKWLRGRATASRDTYTAELVVFIFRRKKPDYSETSLFGT